MKRVGQLLGHNGNFVYDGSVHYDRPIHHNDKIGIEFEVEGTEKFNWHNEQLVHDWWNVHEDGSLRGRSFELVLRRPMGGIEVVAALDAIQGRMDKCRFSNRTSVHVHIDVRDITSTALYRMFLLYLVFEELLFDVCGKRRASNNFCLSSYNANGFLKQLAAISPTQCIRSITANNTAELRYAALNLDAVRKFGSLEFRGHEGTGDVARIATWVNILTHIKHYAVRTRNVEELLTKVSDDGPRIVLRDCFPQPLIDALSAEGDTFSKLLRGARRAQQVIIDRDLQEVGAELLQSMIGEVAPVKKPQPVERDPLVDWQGTRNRLDMAGVRNEQVIPAPVPPRERVVEEGQVFTVGGIMQQMQQDMTATEIARRRAAVVAERERELAELRERLARQGRNRGDN